MLVLVLDTSTPAVTAGLARVLHPHDLAATGLDPANVEPVEVLAECTRNDAFGHAEHLMPLALHAVAKGGATLPELDALVVGIGPGPFTGLRVGMATAQALGDALDRPVYGIPSHDGVAASITASEPFVVVTDARRREVYVSAYGVGGMGGRRINGRRIAGPHVTSPAALADWLTELPQTPTTMTGAGAALAGVQLPTRDAGSIIGGLARAAGPALVTGAVPGPLTPLYLRRPDATEPSAAKSVLPSVLP